MMRKIYSKNNPQKGDGMEIVNVSEVKSLILKAQTALAVALHALNTKILIGEINHPSDSPPKIKRKRRTKKEMGAAPKMDLEKEYQAGRIPPILSASDANKNIGNLPDGDKGNTFYEKKKREKKEPVVE